MRERAQAFFGQGRQNAQRGGAFNRGKDKGRGTQGGRGVGLVAGGRLAYSDSLTHSNMVKKRNAPLRETAIVLML